MKEWLTQYATEEEALKVAIECSQKNRDDEYYVVSDVVDGKEVYFVINWYELNVADLRGWSPEAMVCYEVKNGKQKGVWEDVHPY